jgi:molybdopterin-containing oxidoreductase family membrane subunit
MKSVTADYRRQLENVALKPLVKSSNSYKLLVIVLLAIIGMGAYAYYTQLRDGLGVTGLNDRVSWGFYVTSFVFFIGISHAGTLLSAILRVTGTDWRMPITRLAEVITVISLLIGSSMILVDLGRIERIYNLFISGNIRSPLIWDLLAVTTYLTGSILFLYLPLIPDIALCRDKLGNSSSRFQKWLYNTLALGWRGSEAQKARLEKGMSIMAIFIIPVAVSVHTIISWVFAMTLRPGWDSTIFGPYFVVGAIFSGIAALFIVMAIFRKVFHLEEHIRNEHFEKLSFLFVAVTLIYAYFTFAEYLTVGYKMEGHERYLLNLLFTGEHAFNFWFFVIGGMLIPTLIVIFRRTRTSSGLVVASVLVCITMWIKRYLIVVPTLQVPLMPTVFGTYSPTWVEWSILAASMAGFVLLFVLFVRYFPILPVYEMIEHHEEALHGKEVKVTSKLLNLQKV